MTLQVKHVDGKVVVILNAPPGAGKDTLAGDDDWCQRVGDMLLADYQIDKGGPFSCDVEHVSFKSGMFDILPSVLHVGLDPDGFSEFYDRYDDRALKEQPWDKLGGMSPRQFMIFLSENFMKVVFGKDVFGKFSARLASSCNYVLGGEVYMFSDGGFAEEVNEVVKAVGAENVYVLQWSADGCSFKGDSRRYLNAKDVPDGVKFVMLPHNMKDGDLAGWKAACLKVIEEQSAKAR